MSSGSSFSHSQPTEVDVSKFDYQSSSGESSESGVDNWKSFNNMDLMPDLNWKDNANWKPSSKKCNKQTKPFYSGQNTMNSADYLSASDMAWLDSIVIDEAAVNRKVKKLQYIMKDGFKKEYEIAWLLRAVTCIDLTTLSGDDTDHNVQRLCYKGVRPLSEHLVNLFKENFDYKEVEEIATAAICVYPSRVSAAARVIKQFNLDGVVNIASVATGFPSGQYPLATKLEEIKYCISQGATEIDIVISRELVIANKWKELYSEISEMKKACGNCHMKTILATGECGSLTNVYKASLVAMMAGSDFIKTSTGKETVNATLQVGVVMCRAISDYNKKTGRKVGLKPAGGIRTSNDALLWLVLVKEILGDFWLNSKFFRIGASGLLGDIEKRLFYLITGYTPSKEYLFTT